jgi:hypothetical protein
MQGKTNSKPFIEKVFTDKITITKPGKYVPTSDYVGFDEVTVDIPLINNQNLDINKNGIYTFDENYTGLGTINVNVNKYGTTIDNFLGDVDESGVLQSVTEDDNLNFTGVKEVGEHALSYKFYENKNIKNVSFPDLETIKKEGLRYAFYNGDVETVSFPKLKTIDDSYIQSSTSFSFNALSYAFHGNTKLVNVSFPELETLKCQQAFTYCFYGCTSLATLEFPKLKYVGCGYKNNTFGPLNNIISSAKCPLKNLEFPELEESGKLGLNNLLNGSQSVENLSFPKLDKIDERGCYQMCYNSKSIKNVSFPALIDLNIEKEPFYNAFYKCVALTEVKFPNLETISVVNAFENAFEGCTSLTTIAFPKLRSITSSFRQAFKGCTSLSSVNYPVLEKISSDGFYNAFSGCTALTRIDFPSLTNPSYKAPFGSSSGVYAFLNCTNLTEIHFRADMQEKISALTGYADKWGATNATIYFDL